VDRFVVVADKPACGLAVQVYRDMSEPGGEGGAEAARWLPILGEPVRCRSVAIPLGHDGPSGKFVATEVHH
jgi:hypothetical protein